MSASQKVNLHAGLRLMPQTCDACFGNLRAALGHLLVVLREQGAAPQESVGPSPTDRGKNGSKRHLLVDGRGVPLSLVVTGANRHDVSQLEAVLDALVVERPNPPLRRHKHLCANAGYTGAPALKVIEEHSYIPHAVLPHTAPASGV